MAGANSNFNITELDFDSIKTSLKNYMKNNGVLQDYNYEGSAISTLLDILAYNTQYNAYYLNMVANEMFLDTAMQRNSVVSQAKLLNYTPKSAIAPSATVNITVSNVSNTLNSVTLPKYTKFLSESLDNVNYNFLNAETYTTDVINGVAQFNDVILKQGISHAYSFTVNNGTNPKSYFKIPDVDIDTTTLLISVQESSTNTYSTIYNSATDFLTLDNNSLVYFLQEGQNGYYEIYFGNGILGKQLSDGNIVRLSFISTNGLSSSGANNFVAMQTIGGSGDIIVNSITEASQGSARESIDSIRFQAPKSYASQNRAVTKDDYITAIQQNKLGYSFDAVNVWGGQQNDPPVYGRVFVCMKPTGAYTITENQKAKLIKDVLKPISIMTVEPTIVDPDYTYIQITANVLYDPKKTTATSAQIQAAVKNTINSYARATLNTFNSTFKSSDFNNKINAVDPAIITNEISIKLQKKFFPNLTTPTTYKLNYGSELEKGMFLSGILSTPTVVYRNPLNLAQTIQGLIIEEVPSSTGGIEYITVTNPGFGYQYPPVVTILGDGTGATAEAVVVNGIVREIKVLTKGTGYTSAIVKITNAANDTSGVLCAATPTLEGRYGTLRTYFNDTENVKTVFNGNIGTVDYKAGIVTLNAFAPISVDNPLGQLTLTATPSTMIVSSSQNRIITVDEYDPQSIIVNVTAKST
jgi:hypothetical protein